MKLLLLCAAVAVSAADISAVRNVYLLPMQNGLDQYLAVRLTRDGLFQVVTDPQKANAILTDRIGAGLEQTLNSFAGANKAEKLGDDFRPTVGAGSRGKGAFFLVDPNTHSVLWSAYIESKDSRPASLNRLAAKIVEQLHKNIKSK